MEKSSAHSKAAMLKQCGVKTPMDLAKHLAEFEVNMFASEASVEGTDQNAVLLKEKSTVWIEAKKMANMTQEQETKMQHHYRQWMEDLAQNLGFKANVELAKDGNGSKVTFSSK